MLDKKLLEKVGGWKDDHESRYPWVEGEVLSEVADLALFVRLLEHGIGVWKGRNWERTSKPHSVSNA